MRASGRPSFSLFFNSGGVVYHARALLHREGAWAPFRRQLGSWLERRLPPSEELILVGPSGAHCLPLDWLSRFGRLVVLEPDPLARQIVRARLPSSQLSFEHRDLLFLPLVEGRAGLDAVLSRRPRASVLFCNLLGQVLLEQPEQVAERFRAGFRERILPLLRGRRWATFHDRWSLERGSSEEPCAPSSFARLPSDEELARACFGAQGPTVTAFDHGASELFPAEWPRSYFGWQLTPAMLHVVEALAGSADAQLGSAS